MSQSPQKASASRGYSDGWRAVNLLIRQGGSWSGRERNVFYRNVGEGRFEESSYATGLDFSGDGRAFAVTDFDNDGRLDLALTFRTGPRVVLLRNQSADARALVLAMEGRASNRDAVGAWVTAVTNQRRMHRFVRSGSGFLSQSSRRLHFALAAGETIQSIEIEWPSGARQTVRQPPQNGLYRLVEGTEPAAVRPLPRATPAEAAPQNDSLWLSQAVPAPSGARPRRLVSFHADWCPPCRAQEAEWQKAKLAGQIAIESIDVDKTPMAEWNLIRRHLFDFREDLALPTSLLLDAEGRIVKAYRGVTASATILRDLRSASRPDLPFGGQWALARPRRNFTELATALAEHGLLTPAQRYFALAEPDLESKLNYAALTLEQGNAVESERMLRDVLEQAPTNPDALMNLALALIRQQKPASDPLDRLVTVAPDDAAAWELLGFARLRADQPERAIEAYERARKLGRDTPDVRKPLILLYEATGQQAKAQALRNP